MTTMIIKLVRNRSDQGVLRYRFLKSGVLCVSRLSIRRTRDISPFFRDSCREALRELQTDMLVGLGGSEPA